MRIDGRGDAVVRGAHQVAPGFERPHAGDLQVLMRRRGIAVPRVVGHVDEQRCFAQNIELLTAEGILVANRQPELLSGGA